MSDDIKTVTGTIPPRLTIVKLGQNDEAPKSASEVVPLVPPVAAVSSLEIKPVTGVPLSKKKTARIALDQVTAEPGAIAAGAGVGIASKTIRLGPAMSGQVSIAPLPAVGKALTGVLVSEDTKRKTSRISLDSVLPQLDAASSGGETTPKTIRIKRPSIAPPGGVTPLQAKEPVVVVPAVEGVKTRTAPIDLPPEEVVQEGQQTQKKTIKIRRADGGGAEVKAAPREVSISRVEQDVGGVASAPVPGPRAAPHWSFVLVAAAAVITMCVMLYVLMAQAYPSLGISL